MQRPHTPDIIIERAVELWCRAIKAPKFDNGDNSAAGFLTTGLSYANADHAKSKVDDFDAAVERFRSILVARLIFLRDHDGQPTGKQGQYGPEVNYFDRCLSTDYHPDRDLAEAAKEAGLPNNVFSWKSSVSFYDAASVCASFGYGAPAVYHYPLSDGGWLICELRGEAMPTIIRAVEEGRLPELTIEPAKEERA